MKEAAAKVRWYIAKHRKGVCMLLGKVLHFAKAAVNESLFEYSHTEEL